MNELNWVAEARKLIGTTEIKGAKHNPTILAWVKKLGGWFADDETPWCGTFVAHCLKSANRAIPKHWYRALAYKNYGTTLAKPAYGCIGVMSRQGGGHVCFIIGKTKDGKLVCLGGNQNNQVNITTYPTSRFVAFLWPERSDGTKSVPNSERYNLPIYNGQLTKVVSEA